ncbi:phosphate-starvation-inducible PsiE family protein [Denitromonas halophila]|uniref:Phosphate-starvation-inducible PsiE family protein n=1 Tax=Denitromonas halophila TaxID=1629404 RepID=A0A557QG82_9RHOO|nr:phosphate-starvation-inducible PsiE family protein [Denitromonas halophila]TVO51921.1 hypothetical protein FHP91_18675 [Denitromonas halophila]
MTSEETTTEMHAELPEKDSDLVLHYCHATIRFAVRVLAVMMTGVVLFGIGDVVYVIYQRLMTPPLYLLNISDIFETFAAFLAVLVAIEIFVNIRLYLKSSALPVKLVLATALMAVARKAIVLDFGKHDAAEVLSLAAIVLALGFAYGAVHVFHSRYK